MMDRDSLGLTFAVALVLNLPGAAYLVAMKDIAQRRRYVRDLYEWLRAIGLTPNSEHVVERTDNRHSDGR